MAGCPGNQPPLKLSESHVINVNSGVVEKGLLLITKDDSFTFITGAISGTGDQKKKKKKKKVVLIIQEFTRVLGSGQEPRLKYVFVISKCRTIYKVTYSHILGCGHFEGDIILPAAFDDRVPNYFQLKKTASEPKDHRNVVKM